MEDIRLFKLTTRVSQRRYEALLTELASKLYNDYIAEFLSGKIWFWDIEPSFSGVDTLITARLWEDCVEFLIGEPQTITCPLDRHEAYLSEIFTKILDKHGFSGSALFPYSTKRRAINIPDDSSYNGVIDAIKWFLKMKFPLKKKNIEFITAVSPPGYVSNSHSNRGSDIDEDYL